MRLRVIKELSKREQFAVDAKQQALDYWNSQPIIDKVRIARTKELIGKHIPPYGRVIDIGAGSRPFDCDVALDVAAEVLKGCQEALLPYLDSADGTFFCAICTDVLAELPQFVHRLALSELSRILQPGGYLVCSTQLDQKTYDAKECFEKLICTEFDLIAERVSYAPLFFSETIGRIIRGDGGASHVILIAKKRALH